MTEPTNPRAEDQAQGKGRRWRIVVLAASVIATILLGGSFVWNAHQHDLERQAEERARQQAEQERSRALLARSMATNSHGVRDFSWEVLKERLGETRNVLERAEAFFDEEGLPDFRGRMRQIRAQLDQVSRDREMLLRLEEARLRTAVETLDSPHRNETERFYWQAVREYGLNVDELPPGATAARLRFSKIDYHLRVALDEWMWIAEEPACRARLAEILRQADEDPRRQQLREAIRQQGSATLSRLAREAAPRDLGSPYVILLADALRETGHLDQAIDVLWECRGEHPDDFWFNFKLADALLSAQPPRCAAATSFFTSAARVAYDNPAVMYFRFTGFSTLDEELGEAKTVFREAVRLRPDAAAAHRQLGEVLQFMGTPGTLAMAEASFQEALRLQPDDAVTHRHLAAALEQQGKKEEAEAELREAKRLDPNGGP
jgi:tetratricopeptide (TPR) repeat protein